MPIDRRALVRRHNPVNREFGSLSPFTVGNGRFAFTVDATGLQTFAADYEPGIPLATQSEWGWHTFPNPHGYELADAEVMFDTYGRKVPYTSNTESDAGQWLRANPHRLDLGQIGFEITRRDGQAVTLRDVENIEQKLDLWTGIIKSRFSVDGEGVDVETSCHPTLDLIAVEVKSTLISERRLKIALCFSYGSGEFGKSPANWTQPDRHSSKLVELSANRVCIERTLDADSYVVDIQSDEKVTVTEDAKHHFWLNPSAEGDTHSFVICFAPKPNDSPLPSAAESQVATRRRWEIFWRDGGAIELAGSRDPRAAELERRIVLSQYLTAVQCAGSMPPQETGLTFNSWFGKSHLEMHWWHAVHFALWGRHEFFERSLDWYSKILPRAAETARKQGYDGARWPKMVGPDGRESPSTIGVFLVWQQPHPIYYAELCYREKPTRETLERFRDVVFVTADFMVSYAHWDVATKRYVLGPPLIPAQEHYEPRTTTNPTFELAYWHWALGVARKWRAGLKEPPNAKWDEVYARLAPLPTIDNVYATAEKAWVDTDHPTLLGAFGFLPGERCDVSMMRRTLDRVLSTWQWDKTWGWDYPLTAMTAARIGQPETAIDALLMDVPKNRYLANGHNQQDNRLPIYLPGNGGLLTAVAMMAAGWDGVPERHAPGFPDDDQWQVRWEGLRQLP